MSGPTEQLVVQAERECRILTASMSEVSRHTTEVRPHWHAADQNCIVRVHNDTITRFAHNGTKLVTTTTAAFETDPTVEVEVGHPVLAAGTLLFLVCRTSHPYVAIPSHFDIVVFDVENLQKLYHFGRTHLADAGCMAVSEGELFVCDTERNRVQVFTFTGEHRRSITGEWIHPGYLCCVSDRLYVLEEQDDSREGEIFYEAEASDNEDADEHRQPYGRRIFVMSLQGEALYVHPLKYAMCQMNCFDGKLLLRHAYKTTHPTPRQLAKVAPPAAAPAPVGAPKPCASSARVCSHRRFMS